MGHPLDVKEFVAKSRGDLVQGDAFALLLAEVVTHDVDEHILDFNAGEQISRQLVVLGERQQLLKFVFDQNVIKMHTIGVLLEMRKDRLLVGC